LCWLLTKPAATAAHGNKTASRGPTTAALCNEIEILRRERSELWDLVLQQEAELTSTQESSPRADGIVRARSIERFLEQERLLAAQEATASLHPLMHERVAPATSESDRLAVDGDASSPRLSSVPVASHFTRERGGRTGLQRKPARHPVTSESDRLAVNCDGFSPRLSSVPVTPRFIQERGSRSDLQRKPAQHRPSHPAPPEPSGLPQGCGGPEGCKSVVCNGKPSQSQPNCGRYSARQCKSVGRASAKVTQPEDNGMQTWHPRAAIPANSFPHSTLAYPTVQAGGSSAIDRGATLPDGGSMEPLREALSRALQGLNCARGALAEVAQRLGSEVERSGIEAKRVQNLEQAVTMGLAGLGRELHAIRVESARLRRGTERPRSHSERNCSCRCKSTPR